MTRQSVAPSIQARPSSDDFYQRSAEPFGSRS